MKPCSMMFMLVAIIGFACDGGGEQYMNDVMSYHDIEVETIDSDFSDLDWAGREEPDIAVPCAEPPCTPGEQRCVPRDWYLIERCEDIGGCPRWVFC